MTTAEQDDAGLVGESLAGNRDAFGRIVARYQSLVCALAYSSTGSLSQSQDLAQETFLTAWKHLPELREPARLRSWLCGIARNRIGKALRQDRHEPVSAAEPLETLAEARAPGPLPSERAISGEEQAILWRSLERIPDTYREPLILFYREHQSIAHVARQLELSEEAVRQRLSRGRKLLHEQVVGFVQGALERTGPGKAFTIAVIAALPALVPQAATAGVIATAVKGSSLAKSAATAGVVGTALGPAIGLLGAWFGVRASIRATRSPRERKFVIRMAWLCAGLVAIFGGAMWGIIYFGRSLVDHPGILIGVILTCSLSYVAALFWLILWGNRRQRKIQLEEGTCIEPSTGGAWSAGPPKRAAINGGLGGSIIGGVAWMIVSAIRAGDWPGAGAVAVAAVALLTVSIRVCRQRPERYFSVLAWVCIALGIVTLTLINVRWSMWFGADSTLRHFSAIWASVLCAVLYGILTVVFYSRRKAFAGNVCNSGQ